MKNSSREIILRMVVPAVFVLFLYFLAAPYVGGWGDKVNPQGPLETLKKQLEADEKRALPSSSLFLEQAMLQKLTAEKDKLAREKKSLDEQWRDLTINQTDSGRRIEVLTQIESLLTRHRLGNLEQHPIEGNDSKAQVPGSLKAALDLMAEKTTNTQGRMVRFRFTGRYLDVLQAVGELAQQDWKAYPIALTMEEADWTSEVRKWELVVWI